MTMLLFHSTSSTYLSFLRPLALPRASNFQRFLSITTIATPAHHSPPQSTTATPAPLNAKPASQLPYHVRRTPSNILPIYHLAKRGGNLKQTRLRKIEGNIALLRAHLKSALALEESEIVINQLTKHIIIKGWRRLDVARFLEERKF